MFKFHKEKHYVVIILYVQTIVIKLVGKCRTSLANCRFSLIPQTKYLIIYASQSAKHMSSNITLSYLRKLHDVVIFGIVWKEYICI